MNLLVGFYNDANRSRTDEFIECVRRNVANAHLHSITIFLEDQVSAQETRILFPTLSHSKVQLVEHGKRLTYAHAFDYANRHLAGAGVIVANADIFFDETLALLESESLVGRMLCLSRWDEATDGSFRHFDRPDSQDAWILEAPWPRIDSDFCLGKPGCDSRIAYEAERAGLAVSNPSRSLRARHLHNSGIRHYTPAERLSGPIRLVPASFLGVTADGAKLNRANGFPSHRGFRKECVVNARYREIEAVLSPHFGGAMPRGLRRELIRAVSIRSEGPAPPRDQPLAAVAFREAMGYTLATLEPGVSTHNNLSRPLVSVPDALTGIQFTQVVANYAAPVEIEFQSAGRLFVLAAPGWEGYAPAMVFLDDAGWREPIEPLRTNDGITFEPWTLAGNAGERLVIPTQVMLAATKLLRID